MPTIRGNVDCLQVSDDSSFVTIEDPSTGSRETLILWFNPGPGGGIPSTLTSYTRVMHSMWISLLRDAHTNNGLVSIITSSSSSAIALTVRLG